MGPQLLNLELIKVHDAYYKDFIKNLKSNTDIFDLIDVLIF